MFKRNDFLVAQDRLYKEKVPYGHIYAKYGRHFKCPITYLRVVDRLGVGRGPQVQVVRGGIRYTNVVLRLRSPYGLPISVNIYVGCENKMVITTPLVPTNDGDLTGGDATTIPADNSKNTAATTNTGENTATTVT
ncbi:PREDICTED: uncharacterized protein LOC106121656 [Papilio xuthus]|uniref:Uncharacterized protein LOC106121656 n=1 Tax=Papilio xuthus TaxID=66420 RepID=A0A194QGI2_PAPXU|nr:PREDICTED: uncharacterized protein LOC106121656 [Papilio xuthus]KPJ04602.1 hypothetical protein RR46_03213 [Papilio xuthus]